MSNWDRFPLDYRANEIQTILAAVQAGECVSLVGLSGSGKSNMLGFLAHRYPDLLPARPAVNWPPLFCMLDCNRLTDRSPDGILRFIRTALQGPAPADHSHDEFNALDLVVREKLQEYAGICLLLDRFDSLSIEAQEPDRSAIIGIMRALRDRYKYSLTFVIATRQPLDPHTELSELFYAHTYWLGPLQESDAYWSIKEFATRQGLEWDEPTTQNIIYLSGAYPSLLRAICEAHAAGSALDISRLKNNPAIVRRVEEFWCDQPDAQSLLNSHLSQIELLSLGPKPLTVDTTQLTAKENLLWQYLRNHPGEVCSKDDLIEAVWPEDRVYTVGIRDDSLAQLVRRLREKIEVDPSNPRYLQTVPGRGYRLVPD
ncbi:MAG: winged helix-turn-helix domain-containing protein [Anaerolineales bacterium]|nr:MAG: winged helix-turn-helix domain-containing protein [Anaerolineales bacterium]